MNRLTKYSEINKDYITPYCDNFNCDGCCRECDYEQAIIDKLAEYEDFMEENGFESLEKLKEANDNYRSTAYQYEDDNAVVNELLELLDLPSDENLIIDKIEQLKHDLAVYKIAFENVLSDADEKINTIYRNDCCCSVEMENSQYYLAQAEKKLKGDK